MGFTLLSLNSLSPEHTAGDNPKCILLRKKCITIQIWSKIGIVFNWQYISIGSCNGLTPSRQQTIRWSNDDAWHWYILCGENDNPKFIDIYTRRLTELTAYTIVNLLHLQISFGLSDWSHKKKEQR